MNVLISVLNSSVVWKSFRSRLLSFHVFVYFQGLFLCLIPSLILLWSEKILGIISVLVNLYRFVLWPLKILMLKWGKNTYSIYIFILYSIVAGRNALCLSVRSIWFMISITSLISVPFFMRSLRLKTWVGSLGLKYGPSEAPYLDFSNASTLPWNLECPMLTECPVGS